jgi:DNA-binding protein H-NS
MHMTKSYAQIAVQIKELQSQADKLRREEIAGVVSRIKEAISVYGLTAADLGLRAPRRPGRPASRAKTKATPSGAKYGDGQGNTWGGRGPRPAWLRTALADGRGLEDFLLDGTAARESAVQPAAKRRGAKPAVKRGTAAKRAMRRVPRPEAPESSAEPTAAASTTGE